MKTDILIIGGGPAGIVASMSSRSYYPDKKVTVVRNSKECLIPCGIPYIFGNKLDGVEDDLVPYEKMATSSGIEVLLDEAIKINHEEKSVSFKSGQNIVYEKLIIATGSTPRKLPCRDIKNIHYISKNPKELKETYKNLENSQNIAIVGTGFIGLEVAFELYQKGKNITLIGNKLLGNAFDNDFTELIEEIILKDGIKHHKGHFKDVVDENGTLKAITTDSGEEIECDSLIIAIGYTPNSELAKKSDISLRDGFIYVDEFMRTTRKDIFAIGDCAQKRDFITKRTVPVMLASTATAEARTAVSSLYGINYAKTFSGTIAIFSTVIDNTCFASVGITQERAKKEDIDVAVAKLTVDDKHPAKLPNSRKQTIKLICMKRSGVVVGAQIVGGLDVGEMINVLGVAIENQITIYSLLNLQVATHPLLTSAPTAYPIAKAAQMLDIKINSTRNNQ